MIRPTEYRDIFLMVEVASLGLGGGSHCLEMVVHWAHAKMPRGSGGKARWQAALGVQWLGTGGRLEEVKSTTPSYSNRAIPDVDLLSSLFQNTSSIHFYYFYMSTGS